VFWLSANYSPLFQTGIFSSHHIHSITIFTVVFYTSLAINNEIWVQGPLTICFTMFPFVYIVQKQAGTLFFCCRPISVLTYFSKSFEKVLYVRLNDYFYQKQLVESATIRFSQQPFHIPGYYRLVRKPSSEPR